MQKSLYLRPDEVQLQQAEAEATTEQMSAELIVAHVDRILAIEKAAGKRTPDYYAGYHRAVKQRDAIRVHADPEVFPESLFKERAPNQTDEQHKYVKANYRCTTNPVWQDYLTVQARMWFNSNWQIIWPESAKEEGGLQQYAEEEFPVWRSVEGFVRNIVVPMKAMDANGVVCVHPEFTYTTTADGETVVDDTELPRPIAYYVPSDRVLVREQDLYITVSTERSEVVMPSGKSAKEGRVMYAYTPNEIYRVYQKGKKTENDYETVLYFQHEMGQLPVHDLMGSPILTEDGKVYWRSPFYFATPLLDYALTARNILQVSVSNCAFPFRIVRLSACDFQDAGGRCIGGVYHSTADGSTKTCPACGGKGHRVPISPTGEYQWIEPEGLDAGKGMSYKPVEYVEPQNGSMTFVREQAEIDTQQARAILHLHTSANKAQGGQDVTATEVAMDYSTQFAFLHPIAEQTFDIFEFLLYTVCWQRYFMRDGERADEQMPTVVRPQSFDLRTEGQLWADIETARNAGAPPYIMQTIFHDLLMNRLSSDLDGQKVAAAVMVVDDLFSLTAAEVAARKASGTVEAWQVAFHHAAFQITARLMEEQPEWIDLDTPDRVRVLREYAIENGPTVAASSGLEGILAGIGG